MSTVLSLRLKQFRTYEDTRLDLAPGVNVIHGANGEGKTNLLEALYFACTARSFRTSNERELVRFDSKTTRVEIVVDATDGKHEISIGLTPGDRKLIQVDGTEVERISEHPARPLVSVFTPDRLELIKGTPALRRAHIDTVVGALWPARSQTRRSYARALAQRNALIARIRHGGSTAALAAWDLELARHGIALRDDRAAAVSLVAEKYPEVAGELGLSGVSELRYRPRTRAADAEEFAAELSQRHVSDLERGFTQYGPHRDDLGFLRGDRELRAYGSQGEQRLALLALLLAERSVLASERAAPPLMLLDDVMSELDGDRRAHLMRRLDDGGQSLITTADLGQIPPARAKPATVRVSGGLLHPGLELAA